MEAEARKLLDTRNEDGKTPRELIVGKLLDLARRGNVRAIELLLKREWPETVRVEVENAIRDVDVEALLNAIDGRADAESSTGETIQ